MAGGPGGSGEAEGEEEREGERAAGAKPEEGEERREEDVELLLDPERPGVEEGQAVGVGAEIVELLPEEEVGDRERGGGGRLGEGLQLVRGKPGQRQGDAGEEDEGERGEDAAGAALVEPGEGEAPLGEVAGEDAGDEEARDDEEDVDAEVAAGEGGHAGMEEDDRQHRHGTEAVDVTTVGRGGVARHAGRMGPRAREGKSRRRAV